MAYKTNYNSLVLVTDAICAMGFKVNLHFGVRSHKAGTSGLNQAKLKLKELNQAKKNLIHRIMNFRKDIIRCRNLWN
jgi:hypothetical protein